MITDAEEMSIVQVWNWKARKTDDLRRWAYLWSGAILGHHCGARVANPVDVEGELRGDARRRPEEGRAHRRPQRRRRRGGCWGCHPGTPNTSARQVLPLFHHFFNLLSFQLFMRQVVCQLSFLAAVKAPNARKLTNNFSKPLISMHAFGKFRAFSNYFPFKNVNRE